MIPSSRFVAGLSILFFGVMMSGCDAVATGMFGMIPAAQQSTDASAVPEELAKNPATTETSRPVAPFTIVEPPAESSEFGDNDLSKLEADRLGGAALAASADGEYDDAVQLQYWAVKNGDGSDGLYNLACFYSLAGKADASFYWLQLAAEKQGVDPDWAGEDSDLKNIRKDSRWPKVRNYLRAWNAHWGTSTLSETTLVVPKGYDPATPIPVIVGLHGMGSRASHFVDDDFQDWADELNVAFVGVSGTQPQGPTSFVWSEDPDRDLQRIDDAFAEIKDRLSPKQGQIALFGFSQGAMMAAEIAARHPDRFAGALVMSPGGNGNANIAAITKTGDHQRQGFVCVCGAREAFGNVLMTKRYARDLTSLGCRVEHLPYPGMKDHSFPPDFAKKFPEWIAFMLKTPADAK